MTIAHRLRRPRENGYVESSNARLRDELLNGEIFYSLEEVRCATGWWRDHYNRLVPQQPRLSPARTGTIMPAWPLGYASPSHDHAIANQPVEQFAD